jgi:hypothetical protein
MVSDEVQGLPQIIDAAVEMITERLHDGVQGRKGSRSQVVDQRLQVGTQQRTWPLNSEPFF